MSKMLDPTEDETAMSPRPLRATMTDVMRSGMDVPAARNVSPITWQRHTHTHGDVDNASSPPPDADRFGIADQRLFFVFFLSFYNNVESISIQESIGRLVNADGLLIESNSAGWCRRRSGKSGQDGGETR